MARTPLILALGRQRQVDLFESEASLVHKVSSRTARNLLRDSKSLSYTEKPCLGKKHLNRAGEMAQWLRAFLLFQSS